MSFFDRFRKPKTVEVVEKKPVVSEAPKKENLLIPEFFEVDADEKELVSVIASSILAGDKNDSSWKLKKVLRRNDEKAIVTAIASAILAGDQPESTFKVRSIVRTK